MHKPRFRSLPLTEPAPFVRRYVRVTLAILTVFVALLFLPWRQTVDGIGTLTALDPSERDYEIVATIDGFIEAFYVEENRFVTKGQKLFSMVDPDTHYEKRIADITRQSERKVAQRRKKITRLLENLTRQKKVAQEGRKVFDKRLAQLANEERYLKRRLEAAKDAESVAERELARTRRLQNEGIVSLQTLERVRNRFLQSRATLQEARAGLANTKEAQTIVRHEKERFEAEMAAAIGKIEASLSDARANLEAAEQEWRRNQTALSRYESRDIVAKSDGFVLRIYQNDKNRLVKKGEKILYFSPRVSRRALRVRVSDFHMPLVKEGLKVRIIFYGWPAMQIPGWPRISHGTYGGIVHSVEHSSHEKGGYYVMVTEDPDDAPWPDPELLKIGTQASVWIQLGVVPIWYELWRMTVAQPPHMVTPDTAENPR